MQAARSGPGGSEGRVFPVLLVVVVVLLIGGVFAFRAVFEQGPMPRWQKYDEAVQAFEAGSYGLSAELFERYLTAFGEYAPARYMLGQAEWKLGREEAGVENVRVAAEADPDLDEASLFLAEYRFNRGEFSEALRWSRAALASEPRPPEAEFVTGMCLSNEPHLDIGGAIEHLVRARAGGIATAESLLHLIEFQGKMRKLPGHELSGEYWDGLVREARQALEAVHGETTGSVSALVRWARFHLLVGEPGPALEFLSRRRGAGPEDAEMWLLFVRAYSELDDLVSSRAALRRLLGLERLADRAEELCLFLQARGQGDLLDEVVRTLDAEAPVSPGYAAFRIDRHLSRGEFALAVEKGERSLARWPGEPRLVVRQARALALVGDRNGAIARLETAAEDPHLRAVALGALAEVLLDSDSCTLAELDRVRSILAEPVADEGTRTFLEGLLALRVGDVMRAVEKLTACIRRDPFRRAARERLVQALIRQDDRDGAIREVDDLIAMEGETSERVLLRAKVGLLGGADDLRATRDDAQRALQLDPESRDARRLLARIALSSRPPSPREVLRILGDLGSAADGEGSLDWVLRGEAYLAMDRRAEAGTCAERALALAEGVGERIGALELRQRASGKSGEIWPEGELADGLDRVADRAELHRRMGWLRLEAGDAGGARARAERAIAEEGRTVAGLRLLVEACIAAQPGPEGFAKARGIVREMESADPVAADTLYCRGRVEVLSGEFAEAIPFLERAVGLAPADAYALTELGRARLRTGDADAAATLLERAKRARPDLLDARLLLAESRTTLAEWLEREGRWAEAVRTYGGASDGDWLYAPAVLGLARTSANLRGPGSRLSASIAVEKCERLIASLEAGAGLPEEERHALLSRAWLAKADLHESTGAWRAAAEAVESYLALEPRQEWAELYVGAAWLLAGEPERAAAALEDLAARKPGEWRAAALHSEALMQTGRNDAAAAELLPWGSHPERGTDATLMRARALTRSGREAEALEILGRLFTQFPTAVAAARQALDLARTEEDLADLEPRLSAARDRAEPKGDYTFLAGVVAERRGRRDSLGRWRAALREGFASRDLEMECFARTLKAMLDAGDAAGAREYARSVSRTAGADESWTGRPWVLAEACCLAGVVTHAGGDVPGAKRLFARTLELVPDHALAANNLAYLLLAAPPGEAGALRVARLDEALALARRALRGRPLEPDYLDTMAAMLIAAGRPLDALEHLQVAIGVLEGRLEDDPGGESARRLGSILVRRATACVEADRRDEAREALARARRLDPGLEGDPDVEALEAQLSGE